MNTKFIFRFSFIAILFATIVSSCKKQYDAPPESADPIYKSNKTIKDLKALHATATGSYEIITTADTIVGTVIANDKSGNIYKEIYVQDDAGDAICVNLSGTLYTNFPVGRRVFIFCKGLCLSDYHGLISLGIKSVSNGLPSLEAIPTPLIGNYVVGGALNRPYITYHITQATLDSFANNLNSNTAMQHRLVGNLVQLDDYEFQIGDTKRSLGDTSNYKSITKGFTYIKQCGSTTKNIVATSGYADFAANPAPSGNGTVTAILTVYGTTPQLVLRDMSDLQMNGARCFLFEEDFNSYTVSTSCLNTANWNNIQESGDVCFTIASFSGGVFSKVSAFTSTALPTTNIVSWLAMANPISIPSGLSPKLSFTCANRYTVGTLKALISTDYNGGNNPASATWVPLATLTTNSSSFTPFNPYGPFDLSAYAGKNVYIAFKYEVPAGSSKNAVGTFEVDDLRISKN